MNAIQMVDLQGQYLEIKTEVDNAIQDVIDDSAFIRGHAVEQFERELAAYLGGRHCVGVGNGTDALQIAMMAAGIGQGDEVITTPFTFVATAEAAALLGATPVFVDIDPDTFNIDPGAIRDAITPRTRAVVPVHLFGQPADMEPIVTIAREHDLIVIEDNAQAVGASYLGRHVGYIGDCGCVSFFPSKNLGAFGDGGAITTERDDFAQTVRMISNHGSRRKYHNEIVGVNSRLDTMQAAILRVKLRRLDDYIQRRQHAAEQYDASLGEVDAMQTPFRAPDRNHVFHQYTVRIRDGRKQRDALAHHLRDRGIPTAVYYPVPLHQLPIFTDHRHRSGSLSEAERAAEEVLSLPMHTQLDYLQIEYICDSIASFFG